MLINNKDEKENLLINYMLMLGACFFFISGFIGLFIALFKKNNFEKNKYISINDQKIYDFYKDIVKVTIRTIVMYIIGLILILSIIWIFIGWPLIIFASFYYYFCMIIGLIRVTKL